ncbi:MAG: hypothetical protein ACR2MT_13655 [Aurantibacter sp.]
MKKFLNYALYTGLLVTALAFTSCQKEKYDVAPQDEQETMEASSATAKLIERTVSNDGSWDNIVDGSSCFDIRFPYTVDVNGVEITVDSHDDLEVIEGVFDAIDGDEDLLDIIFPITITMGDYTEVTINSKEDLREIADQCVEGGDDDDIECIDVVYPVQLFTFDTNLSILDDYTINSDLELRRFMAGLGENDIISIDFPVTFELYDGSEVVVNTLAELAATIEGAKDMCDEDDDNDHNDDDFTKERLDNLLVECPWSVKEIERDYVNHTDQYREYLMNFSEDGGVTVIDRAGNVLHGEWSTRVAEHKVLLKLEFDVLVDFTLEWFVYEIEEGKIKLYSGEHNKIILESVCDIVNSDPNTLRDILKECEWVIKKVKVDDVEIRRLLGYEFKFMAEGVVTLSNGDVTSNGTWEITMNAQGRLVMAIVMGDEPGVSFEWPLTDLRDDRLKFEIPGTDYELVLQRVCDDNNEDGDVVEIRNIMMSGDWHVASYTENGEDKTQNYNGFSFDFYENHHISATLGQTGPSYPGYWRVLRNYEHKLKVYLNFGEDGDLGDLTDDYDFVSINSNRVELKDVSGDGSISVLVFEK